MLCKFLLQVTVLAFFILAVSSCACDPEGKKECAWSLEPEPDQMGRVQLGYVPVCARNRRTMKQDCRLQIKASLGQESQGHLFRYIDMKVTSVAIPRTISEITYCK